MKRIIDENLYLEMLRVKDLDRWLDLLKDNYDYFLPWLSWIEKANRENQEVHLISIWMDFLLEKAWELGVFYKNHLVGSIRLERKKDGGELGFLLSKNASGKGIMTRAVENMTDFAFKELGLPLVYMRILKENKASRHVAERLGYGLQEKRQYDEKRQQYFLVYQQTLNEWREVHDGSTN